MKTKTKGQPHPDRGGIVIYGSGRGGPEISVRLENEFGEIEKCPDLV